MARWRRAAARLRGAAARLRGCCARLGSVRGMEVLDSAITATPRHCGAATGRRAPAADLTFPLRRLPFDRTPTRRAPGNFGTVRRRHRRPNWPFPLGFGRPSPRGTALARKCSCGGYPRICTLHNCTIAAADRPEERKCARETGEVHAGRGSRASCRTEACKPVGHNPEQSRQPAVLQNRRVRRLRRTARPAEQMRVLLNRSARPAEQGRVLQNGRALPRNYSPG